jgi:NAD(P)-dependent dehydrogenase (short-subunit alcohol dehydrogenase family)
MIVSTGTGGHDAPSDSPRTKWDHILSVNVTSQAILTDKLAPLLDKSPLPKVIFVSSGAGSTAKVLDVKGNPDPKPLFAYGASKAALNNLMALYSRLKPGWKVNAVSPGRRRTRMNQVEESEETDPKLGAVRVVELVKERKDGATGTFSNAEGPMAF